MKDQIKNITQEQSAEIAGLLRYLLEKYRKDIELGRDGIGWNKDTDLG